jgi:peptide methionine sulfoxide reductase MsrB
MKTTKGFLAHITGGMGQVELPESYGLRYCIFSFSLEFPPQIFALRRSDYGLLL